VGLDSLLHANEPAAAVSLSTRRLEAGGIYLPEDVELWMEKAFTSEESANRVSTRCRGALNAAEPVEDGVQDLHPSNGS
jgi:hypothetical protein